MELWKIKKQLNYCKSLIYLIYLELKKIYGYFTIESLKNGGKYGKESSTCYRGK